MHDRRRALLLTVAAAATALVLTGCGSTGGSAAGDGSSGSERSADAGTSAESGPVAQEGEAGTPGSASDSTTSTASVTDRSVIRTAQISIQTGQVDEAVGKATAIVTAVGGTLTSEQRYGAPSSGAAETADPDQPSVEPLPGTGEVPSDGMDIYPYPYPYPYPTTGTQADLVYRVPPDSVDQVLAELSALGTVESRSQSSRDVTEQVVDVDARIASLQASAQRLRELLDRAESVADVAAIEAELSRREAELQSLQAQQRSLADQVAAATVSVYLFDAPAAGEVEPGGFLGGLRSGWDAFVTGLGWLATGLGAALPFLLVLGAGLAGAFALVRRRGRASRPGDPAGPPDNAVSPADATAPGP